MRAPLLVFKTTFFAFLSLIVFLCPSAFAQETKSAPVMFVLDGSNSMWGRIEGTAKIAIAKDVLTALLYEWDAEQSLGLMVYGHRKKDDCSDIETIAVPGQVSTGTLIEAVDGITPRGKTPISSSLFKAFNTLSQITPANAKHSVVLVSDGLETCEGDPCAMAFSLNIVNPGFDVHVVGFDLTDEESEALACIAERSGGKFYRAGNASELRDALSDTLVAAAAPVPAPVETPNPAPARAPTILLAKLCAECPSLPALDAQWRITDANDTVLYNGLGVMPLDGPQLNVGEYSVTVRYLSSALVRAGTLRISPDGQQGDVFNLEGGAALVRAFATPERDVPATPIQFDFFTAGSDGALIAQVAQNGQPVYLPAGTYRVRATHDVLTASTEIDIAAGQETARDMDIGNGYVRFASQLNASGTPAGGAADYEIFANLEDAQANRGRIAFVLGSQEKTLPLEPGDYVAKVSITYQRKVQTVRQFHPFRVVANETTIPEFQLGLGFLTYDVKSQGNAKIYDIAYIREEDGLKVGNYNLGWQATVALEPGTYHLAITIPGEVVRTDNFAVEEGKTTTVNATLP